MVGTEGVGEIAGDDNSAVVVVAVVAVKNHNPRQTGTEKQLSEITLTHKTLNGAHCGGRRP